MAFSFNPPQAQSQPFGGGTSTTGFSSGFGSFGQQSGTQSTFGGSTFGAPATSTSTAAPTFGGGFGGGTTFGTPQTGTVFGQQQQQQQPQQQTTGFGQVGGTTFGGTSTQGSTGFGTGTTGFGTGTTSTGFGSSGGSLFGTAQPQTSTSFGTTQPTFGGTQTSGFGSGLGTSTFGSTQPSLFGTTQPTTGFGTSQASTSTGSWFGSTQQQQPTTFTSFGSGTGGLFGQKPGGFAFPSTFGQQQQQQQMMMQQQQQQQQQVVIDEQAAFHQSIFGCCKFGDERDSILANLNFVQACWGAGKGFYNQTNPPVPYNDKNVIYRFKAVVYSFMYTESNEDGNVVIHIKKPQSKVCDEESQLIASLQNMLAKPNIFFKISGTKALSEDLTVIVLTADDRSTLRRVLATDLAAALLQPQFKPQLDNLGVVSVYAKVKPSPEQLKAYLDNAPAGLDPRVWKKAQEDNPDPENMIPVPLLGPEALKNRIEAQQKENQQHFNRLRLIGDEVSTLHNRHANMSAELQQLRHRYTILTHRIISAIVRLQILQKQGFPIQPEEEELKKQIMQLEKQLNSPTHFRGRLNELMSHVRLHKNTLENRGLVKYSVDASTLEQIKEFLSLQQGSITCLVETVKSSMDYVRRMNEDLVEFNEKRVSS